MKFEGVKLPPQEQPAVTRSEQQGTWQFGWEKTTWCGGG
jgi:hypothetical protein